MNRKDAIEVYISAAKKIQVSPAKREKMNTMLEKNGTAGTYSPEMLRAEHREKLWYVAVRWGSIAAVVVSVLCGAFLVYDSLHTHRTEPTATSQADLIPDPDLSGYFAHSYGNGIAGAMLMNARNILYYYQSATQLQQDTLRQMEKYLLDTDPPEFIENSPVESFLWEYVSAGQTQQAALQALQACETMNPPEWLFGFSYNSAEGVLYFTVCNTADTAMEWLAECTLTVGGTNIKTKLQNPAYVQLWLGEYYNGAVCADASGRDVLVIPAHGCAEVCALIPDKWCNRLIDQLLILAFTNSDGGLALTKRITLDEKPALPRAERNRLLNFALQAEPAPWEN